MKTLRGPLALLSLLALFSAVAHARGAEDVFAGKIMVTKTRLPDRFRSASEFVSRVKQSSVGSVWPEKSGDEKGKWKFEYIAFFARPLNDLEVTTNIYDVTGGAKRFIQGGSTYVQNRSDRILASSMTIGPPEFEPNKRILITMESRGHIIATTTLILRGDGPKYSGRVDFTDEEAKAKQ